MDEFKEQVKRSFKSCRKDIESLQEDNNSLKEKYEQLEEENSLLKDKISTLESQNNQLKGELDGIKIALEYIKSMQPTSQETREEESIFIDNEPTQKEEEILKPSAKSTNPSSTSSSNSSSDPYEALLAYKAKTNKREILKQKLLSMVSENGILLSELKFMFVDHFGYCSKATFYNYLKELELEKTIYVEREKSKNFVYLNSIRQQV